MIFSLVIPEELQTIFLIVIVASFAIYLAYKIQLRNIVFIFLMIILLLLFMYFLDLISLEIAIFPLLLLPLTILFICKLGVNEDVVD